MPKKIRQLKKMLKKAGFASRPGRGSHQVWKHPMLRDLITISFKDGEDAPPYLEDEVNDALKLLAEIQKQEDTEQ